MGFLDNVFGGDDNKKGKKTKKDNNNNPLANALQQFNNKTKKFQGAGQSLGGSKPGEVIAVSFKEAGPLGVRVEKKSNTSQSAIVNQVVPNTQAEAAGLQRGDILCFRGSNGQEEIPYKLFLDLAHSGQRPIELEVRRLKAGSNTAAAAASTTTATTNTGFKSADAEARRQQMIAAAEARDKKHKKQTKTIKHVTKSTLLAEKEKEKQQAENAYQAHEPLSEASRQAAAAAKQDEAMLASKLGYNPYETAKSTAGQGRNATTAVQHGTINSSSAGDHLPSSNESAIPAVAPPSEATTSVEDNIALPNEAEEALVTVLSSNNTSAVKIVRTLIINAATKGQLDGESSETFRKVRLQNPKIKAAVVETPGALDWMMVVGFQLVEDDETKESVLVFPPSYEEPEWLQSALKRMEEAL